MSNLSEGMRRDFDRIGSCRPKQRRCLVLSRFGVVIAILCVTCGLGYAQGKQSYPSRPVRLIAPFPPGGGADVLGRLLAGRFADELGQTFVVDNRGGAGGTLGTAIAAEAPPDGYTIIIVTSSFVASANYYRKLPYDSVNDFDAIGRIAATPMVLVVLPSLPANSTQELIALAKAKPGALNYSSSGAGAIIHLATELFLTMSGTRITHIPYKGGGPARNALLSAEVQVLFAPLGTAFSYIQNGRLKVLSVSGGQRSALLPSVPTLAESGVPGYEAEIWYGLLAPRGTPRSVLELLNRQISVALKTDELRRALGAQGFKPASTTPKQFGAFVKSEIAKWGKVMKDAGVQQN